MISHWMSDCNVGRVESLASHENWWVGKEGLNLYIDCSKFKIIKISEIECGM